MCRGVSAVSFSTRDSCIYTSGADGMICKTDPQTGNTLGKFRASTKAISCMSVSSGIDHSLQLCYSCFMVVGKPNIFSVIFFTCLLVIFMKCRIWKIYFGKLVVNDSI